MKKGPEAVPLGPTQDVQAASLRLRRTSAASIFLPVESVRP